MKTVFSIMTLALLGLSACKTAQIAYTPAFETEGMNVKGRNGLQIGQVIRYGDYTTDKVRRGWTKSYDIPFFIRFQGAREKLSFTQFGPDGQQAQVACISRFNSVELPLIRDYFSVLLDMKHYFAGNISLNSSSWDFILYNPTGDFLREKATAGFIKSSYHHIAIHPIKGLEGQAGWAKELAVYGYEFSLNGKAIAAVSTVNNGKVWIADDLDGDLKTVIAAVVTGLLLRTDVEEAATI